MAENPSVKKYYDYAQQQVDEQAIADKFNAATAAQFNVQREQNRQAENQFYNQMYNTQRTAMDTIRQANAAAVSTGASRGVQAANELSALLGLQDESVAAATELAQANRQTAQEETAAVLENMLNAYQQAVSERQQLVQQGIESASVDVQQEANVIAGQEAATNQQRADTERGQYLRDLHVDNPSAYYAEVAKDNAATDFTNMSDAQYATNARELQSAITEISNTAALTKDDINSNKGKTLNTKLSSISTNVENLYTSYGLSVNEAKQDLAEFNSYVDNLRIAFKQPDGNINQDSIDLFFGTKGAVQNALNTYLKNKVTERYNAKYTANKTK